MSTIPTRQLPLTLHRMSTFCNLPRTLTNSLYGPLSRRNRIFGYAPGTNTSITQFTIRIQMTYLDGATVTALWG